MCLGALILVWAAVSPGRNVASVSKGRERSASLSPYLVGTGWQVGQ